MITEVIIRKPVTVIMVIAATIVITMMPWRTRGFGLVSYAVRNGNVRDNTYAGNGNTEEQQKVSGNKYILMP